MPDDVVPPHPRVPVWLRPLTRRRDEVQFGVLPGGPVVSGITGVEADLLARLDGGLPLASTDRVAAEAGVDPARWHELLALATRLGVVTDRLSPPTPGAYAVPPGRVVVDGRGAVASDIAAGLGAAGVTVVHGRAGVDRALAAPDNPRPDLVVLVGSPVVDPRRGDVWLRRGVAHLPVAPSGPRTVVGPLADGSPGAPCLWCLDRHRADRDDAWPTVMSQAAPQPGAEPARRWDAEPEAVDGIDGLDGLDARGARCGVHDALTPGLGHLVVGAVTLLVTGLLAGHRPPPGVSVEVSLPWPRMDHRRWPTHPLCPRHPGQADATAGPTQQTGRQWLRGA